MKIKSGFKKPQNEENGKSYHESLSNCPTNGQSLFKSFGQEKRNQQEK